jgi:hypothetical protein
MISNGGSIETNIGNHIELSSISIRGMIMIFETSTPPSINDLRIIRILSPAVNGFAKV